jgi:hypothetical protein
MDTVQCPTMYMYNGSTKGSSLLISSCPHCIGQLALLTLPLILLGEKGKLTVSFYCLDRPLYIENVALGAMFSLSMLEHVYSQHMSTLCTLWSLWHCPSPGLFAAPYLEFPDLSLICYVKPIEKPLPSSPGQRHDKLTSLRCENRKIRYENKNKKLNGSIRCRNYRMIPKTYVKISWDYPFKWNNDYSDYLGELETL